LNPSGDYLVNWNNKPGHGVMNPDEFWYSWAEADRVDYLQHAIEEQPRFSADQAWDLIAKSSYADLHITYLSELIAQATETDKSLDGMGRLLQKWNGVYEDRNGDGYYDGPAPAIFRAFLGQLITEVLEDDLGDIYPYFSATGYPTPGKPTIAGTNIQPGFKAVFESLRGRGDFDLLNSVSAVDIVRQSLKKTQSLLTETKGRRMGRWKLRVDPRPYSKRNFLGVPQDFYQQPLMSPIEQNRGTENNMIVMSPDQIVGYEVAPPGQNAFVNSAGERAKNFEDQLELYENFGKKRMWFYPADVESNKVSDVKLMLPPR
jgi:penicillin amidase